MAEINVTSFGIVNDIQVVCPSSNKYMTTFVLLEQQDWFEDEMKFIRTYIKPGMNVLDIGANYGLYTLTIAKIVGDHGKIWAFEPTSFTSACLERSISINQFDNITLIKVGLSNKIGKAKLYLSPNSELNSLSQEAVSSNRFEKISLLTLDHCKHKFKWGDINFIKLDAEGEEINILKKGRKTLSTLSPLIMFELKHGEKVNLPLVDRFVNMEYNIFRLIPGLNVLIPFDHNKPFDGYLLNVFCCKKDKEKELETKGILVRDFDEINDVKDLDAFEIIKQMTFGESLMNHIVKKESGEDKEYIEILTLYLLSQRTSTYPSCKVWCLMRAVNKVKEVIARGDGRVARLATFSRVLFDAGERSLGVKVLSDVINKYHYSLDFQVNDLCLPASKKYDTISPGSKVQEWLFSSILEQYIAKHAYSAYFSKEATLPLFHRLKTLGFFSDDMHRREQLIKKCFS